MSYRCDCSASVRVTLFVIHCGACFLYSIASHYPDPSKIFMFLHCLLSLCFSVYFSMEYYLKTRTCKFGVTCKFHHPRNKTEITGRVSLNMFGYPLRPVMNLWLLQWQAFQCIHLKSPMAGTFYRSPGPGEPPFVKVGDKVQKGQVVCIIEAMKLMNEIEAEKSGTINELLAEDGKPVSVDTIILLTRMSKQATFLPFNLLLAPLLLLLLLSCVVHGVQEKKILSLHNNIWSPKRSNVASSSCFSHNHNLGKGRESTTLEMQHRQLCSGKTIDWGKKLRRALVLDNLRVQSLQLRIKSMSSSTAESISETQIPLTSGINLETLNYIVTVELGGKNMSLIVDTGSDLTWVQCQPCKSCYNQQGSLYDPSLSSSYKTVFCNSSACQELVEATGNSGLCGGGNNPVEKVTCDYVVSYGDGSYTRGDLGSENIQLGDNKVENIVFGCGRNNKGLFGEASGLMGLGRSSVSLVTQTLKTFNGVFSYCLPSLEEGASGSLSFGNDSSAYKITTSVSYTPLLQNPQLRSFYVLNLTGASIGGVEMESSSFGREILIDSGTVITRLPPSIYKAVKTEFLKQFSGFPSAPGYSILDTCFNLTSYEEVSIPTVKMFFEGNAELEVDVSGVFYFVKPDASLVCLALASLSYENEVGIIGNYLQKNQRVIYDTKQEKLGIAGEICSN